MIIARIYDDSIEIKFGSYMNIDIFKSIIEKIKSIPGRRFHSLEGDSYWVIPSSERRTLETLFPGKQIIWEDAVVETVFVPKNISDNMTHLNELLLQPYAFQVLGINFLCERQHCMLADEMGLGKSIEILAGIYKLYRSGKVKKALIICPATLKYQWEQEIEKFINTEKYDIDYIVVDGSAKERKEIYKSISEGDILYSIINYELVRNDIDMLSKIKFDAIAADESHRLKNRLSKTSEAIMKLNAEYKWAATGTPMQNRPEELFNIFKWIDPKILGDWWKFRGRYIIIGEKFRQPNMVLGYKNLGELHGKITPYMLRRLKKDVAPELPKMLVNNFFVPMTKDQAEIHENIRNELIDTIKEISKHTVRDEDGNIIKQHPKANQILGMFVMLQEVCDTPELLSMSDSGMASKYVTSFTNKKSPKIEELLNILSDFLVNDPKGKAVIFTQFERMQRLVVSAIKKLGKVETVNGQMNAKTKQENILRFRTDSDIKFLVCTDSANYGVNLPEASLLVNVDVPWNPAVLDQRNARIHRLDSIHESVNIVNLISTDGLDEKILETLYAKKNTAEEIVENRENEVNHLSNLTNDLMRKLLSKKKHKNKKKGKL